jgi:FkbM family methyltransferase
MKKFIRKILKRVYKKLFVPTNIKPDKDNLGNKSNQNNALNDLLLIPRFKGGIFKYDGFNIEYIDAASLHSGIDLLFQKGYNDFHPENENPYIIDCGSNIGLSILNYKKKYPKSRIIGFEPDPDIFQILKRNIKDNDIKDIEIVQAAVWNKKSSLTFYKEGCDGGRIIPDNKGEQIITVEAIDILEYINEPIDLIKIDIESAEYIVVPHLLEKSNLLKNIIIEFHYLRNKTSLLSLSKVLSVLAEKNFDVTFNSFGPWRDLIHEPAKLDIEFDQYFLITAKKQ